MLAKILLFVCIWPIVPLIAAMLCNEARAKKGIVLGVTLPHSARSDARVVEITRRHRRAQWLWAAAVTVVWGVPHFLLSDGAIVGLTFIVLLPMIIVPYVIFVRANKKLRALKKAEGWATPYTGGVVVDLKTAAEPGKPLSRWLFLPPVIISLVPLCVSLAARDEDALTWGIVCGSVALVCALCAALYPMIFRQRPDVAGGDSDVNAAITRVRRYNWGKMLLITAYLTALYVLANWLLGDSELWLTVATIAYLVVLLGFCMSTEFAVRRAMERLTASGETVVDEDDLWLWGLFYNNPGDRHLFINDRTGSGMGVNVGRPAGRAIIIGTALLLVGIMVFGVTMAAGFDAPREGYIEGDTLYFQHFAEKYEIDLAEITDVELLDELPSARRVAGTGLPNLLEGRFTVEGYDNVRISLNPQEPPFIAVVTPDMTRIFSLGTPEETGALYDEILEAIEWT